MNPARLKNDREKLRALAARAPTLLEIEREVGNPPHEYFLRLHCRGVERLSAGHPIYREVHSIRIRLQGDYPFSEPSVDFLTPILHPHVWVHDSHVCLGGWRPTEFLDLLVCRLFRVIQLDPAYINANSVANQVAYAWVGPKVAQFPLGTADPCTAAPPKPLGIRFTAT